MHTTEEYIDPLYDAFLRMPFFDSLFFQMQARNICIVNLYIKDQEKRLWEIYMDRERAPIIETTVVAAFSQMWVFSVYEILRTWRQLAKELIEYGKNLRNAGSKDARHSIIERKAESLSKRREISSTPLHASYIQGYFKQIEDDDIFIKSLEVTYNAFEEVIFRKIEALRVTLAKHEIPKTKGVFASAPGYVRIGNEGSIQWQIEYKDGDVDFILRSDIVEDLINVGEILQEYSSDVCASKI